MTFLLLTAGKGSRLHPITLHQPKSLFRLDEKTTVLQRMIGQIRTFTPQASIIIVDGFMKESIEAAVPECHFIYNPFYAVTNSLASVWFARECLEDDNVTIVNGDIVVSDELFRDLIAPETGRPFVLCDNSIKRDGDYNVQALGDRVLVMSKDLEEYSGEYAGITKLDHSSAALLKEQVEQMIGNGMYDQWYENALVQMIFEKDFSLYYEDVSGYEWTEVDCVDDLFLAKRIHQK